MGSYYGDPSITGTLGGNVEWRRQRGKHHPAIDDKGTEEGAGEEQEYCKIECAEFGCGTGVSQFSLSLPSEKPPESHEVVVSDCHGWKYIKMSGTHESVLLRVKNVLKMCH